MVTVVAAAARVHGIDVQRVEEAIRAAERRTSGEIRVAVARFYFWGDVHRAAAHAFARLRMSRTRLRNGVLIFLAPRRRQLVVLGDVGIHQRVAPTFWRDVADAVAAALRAGDVTAALVQGVAAIGEELAAHFPPDPAADVNELPDAVDLPGRAARKD